MASLGAAYFAPHDSKTKDSARPAQHDPYEAKRQTQYRIECFIREIRDPHRVSADRHAGLPDRWIRRSSCSSTALAESEESVETRVTCPCQACSSKNMKSCLDGNPDITLHEGAFQFSARVWSR